MQSSWKLNVRHARQMSSRSVNFGPTPTTNCSHENLGTPYLSESHSSLKTKKTVEDAFALMKLLRPNMRTKTSKPSLEADSASMGSVPVHVSFRLSHQSQRTHPVFGSCG